MADNRREQMEFVAAKQAISSSQNEDMRYRLYPDNTRLTLSIGRVAGDTKVARLPEIVPGLVFDVFHLGQASATRDALNRAYAEGRADEVRARRGE